MSLGAAIYPPLTALGAFGLGAQSAAHNLANVLTEGFKAGRVTYADLPGSSGARAVGPQRLETQGPLIPHGPGLPPGRSLPAGLEGFAEGSTTDLAREMVNLLVTSRAYQANAKVASTVEAMLGAVVNLKV